MEFERKEQMALLKECAWNETIKIITGARRVGKSYLLFDLYKKHLLDNGVKAKNIISLPLDTIDNVKYRDRFFTWDSIKKITSNENERYYVFIDEIQMMDQFEELMNSLLRKRNIDTYVTGSNSKLLTTDVATEFRGRGTQIPVHPLTFSEIAQVRKEKSLLSLFSEYLKFGGMPHVWKLENQTLKEKTLFDYFQNTYVKDVLSRDHSMDDYSIDALSKSLASNIGSLVSLKRFTHIFQSRVGNTISQSKIYEALKLLENSFVISEAKQFDVKGNKYIGSESKYYFEDLGIRNAVLNFRESDEYQKLLENAVYLELKSRGFHIDVGRVADNSGKEKKEYEVDFVTTGDGQKIYIQVALNETDEKKRRQESRSLLAIKDGFKKMIISSTTAFSSYDEEGIMHINLFDFFLNPKLLDNDLRKIKKIDFEK